MAAFPRIRQSLFAILSTMPIAYSYIRMSRPEQLRGDSLRRQMAAAAEWAAKRGVELDDSLRDIGVSAYKGKNRDVGALGTFIRMVEDGTVRSGSFLLVESLDRLSRETVIEALPRFIDLVNAGIIVVTLIDGQEYSKKRLKADWTPLIVSLATMARAHEESKTKGIRVREAWDAKRAKAGQKVLTSRVPAWLTVVDGQIRTVPTRVELVRRIFRETGDGQGRRIVVRRLNDERIPPFMGGKVGWQPSYIAKLLSNRAVLGEFQAYRRGEDGKRRPEGDPVPGYFPAIVTESEFHHANVARSSRTSAPGPRGNGVPNLFTGIAKCGVCRSSMVMLNKGASPKGARYLVCSNADRSAGCANDRRWRLDGVEVAVLGIMHRVDISNLVERAPEHKREAEDLKAKLAALNARRERLLDLVEDGDEAAKARFKTLGSEIGNLRESIDRSEHQERVDATQPSHEERLASIREIQRLLAMATGEALRDLRLRLAQHLRGTLLRIDFDTRVVTCRVRLNRTAGYRWTADRYPDGVPMIAIDERRSTWEPHEFDDQDAQRSEPGGKLPADVGRMIELLGSPARAPSHTPGSRSLVNRKNRSKS
ncbi:recombinase family protein [Methylobacterium sp. J-092]|uniref:recombinase family protein n=1 Tax=Methylobacterium sp. J-092 TaxID=2836667 RepID=UPI001FB9BEB2|nr:recombinase family protein [Methylobacterium sp. J-092]MCJ2009577.1 recombinase family protein [Methylobacterium sp. J-092]